MLQWVSLQLAAWLTGGGVGVEVPSRSFPTPTDGMFMMATAVIATSSRSCWLIAVRTNQLTLTLVTSDTLLRSFWKGCRVQSLGLLQPSRNVVLFPLL